MLPSPHLIFPFISKAYDVSSNSTGHKTAAKTLFKRPPSITRSHSLSFSAAAAAAAVPRAKVSVYSLEFFFFFFFTFIIIIVYIIQITYRRTGAFYSLVVSCAVCVPL